MIVPVTVLMVLGGAFWWGHWEVDRLVQWGTGTLVTAALGHLLYRSFDYAERGDPALAWVLVGCLAAAEWAGTGGAAWRSWSALAAGLGSAWWMLGVHRQPRVSGLTFRAGALAGVAWWLEPSSFGVALAAAVVLAKTRTFLLREWLLLVLGTAWIPATAFVLTWNGWHLPARAEQPWVLPSLTEQAWAVLAALLTAAGWISAALQSRSAGIRRKAARLNLALLTGLSAIWALATAPGQPHTWRLTAVAVAFAWVWLVPPSERVHGAERWIRGGLWALLLAVWLSGIALALTPA